MSIQVTKESGGEDITGPCRVYLSRRVGREALGGTVLEERCSMTPVSGYEKGYL
jgi:hypothetical protein